MPITLKFTPPAESGLGRYHGNTGPFYFQNLGLPWPRDLTKRMIERTTDDRAQAREFETVEAAREVLVTAGNPPGWDVSE